MALSPSALGCTHIAADAWFTGEGRTRWGEPREQDNGSAAGREKQGKVRDQIFRMKSSTDNSTSRRIERRRPGPSVSRECTGMVVTLPSGCFRKTWLPRVRITSKPILGRARTASLPVSRGRRVIQKFAECPQAQAESLSDGHPPGTIQPPRVRASSGYRDSEPGYDIPAKPAQWRHSSLARPVRSAP